MKRKTMNIVTKRAVIATAALAAAGLFGSLPYGGSPVAQQGVPTVHREVALVDITDTTLLTDEATLNTAILTVGAEGQSTLLSDLTTSFGSKAADALLDTTTAAGVFGGSEAAGGEGVFLDGLVIEDEVNQLVGISAATSEGDIFSYLSALGLLSTAEATELSGAEGTSAFDTDLTTIANGAYTLASTDFSAYLTALSTDTSASAELPTLFTDLGTILTGDVTALSTDLTNVLTDVGSLF
jgi:hypothetical protein